MAPISPFARVRGRYPLYSRDRLRDLSRRLRQGIHPQSAAADRIEMAGPTGRITFSQAEGLDYRQVGVGEPLGPLWATYWFRVTVTVPQAWAGARVDLDWDSRSEALLWLAGRSSRGLNIGRRTVPLVARADGGETLAFHVEVACNRAFGVSEGGPAGGSPRDPYLLAACEIRSFDPEAWRLYWDFEVLRELEADRAPPQVGRSFGGGASPLVRPALDTTWAGKLLQELNDFANRLDSDDRSTWPEARAILDGLLRVRNGGVTHDLSAIGHAHIDTAWLWPIEETWRKCQRTFATSVALMDAYPTFLFACSQACQYVEIERRDPDLFARIREKHRARQWIPIGGSWVEPDCNLPSGESLCRQFLYGQRYFERTFGARSRIFWNPDVFGYSGQLPQIMRQAGMDRFLTQKLSWNRFTSPPHHSFRWRGIDGTEVLTHFPPADTYNGMATVEELRHHGANYKDADRSADGLYLFGFGDGGGGPTEAMVERLTRCADLQGVPRVTLRGPDAFFDRLDKDAGDLGVIEGELYFEYHRGVYTSQAEVKRLNRLIEGKLADVEFLATIAHLDGLDETVLPSRDDVEGLWRILLTNQFHDILPGSSIHEVYERTAPELGTLAADVATLVERLAAGLSTGAGEAAPLNPLGVARREVASTPSGDLAFIEAAPFSVGRIAPANEAVRIEQGADGEVRLENSLLVAVVSGSGDVISLIHKESRREAIAPGGGRILLFDDRPTNYDAWDIDPFALETAREAPPSLTSKIASQSPLRIEVECERRLGKASAMTQRIRLDALSPFLEFDTTIDWRERHTLVKQMFPVTCRAPTATFEIAFGAVERPTHANTDADLARYESPAHRWIDLSEPGFGVSLLSDARYGFSVFENQMAVSLVRGPTTPDPQADIGIHRYRLGLYPHRGDWRSAGTVGLAAGFNRPVLWLGGEPSSLLRAPLVAATPASVIVDTIKPAEDGEGWVIRLYEAHGGHVEAQLTFGAAVRAAFLSNTLEDRLSRLNIENGRLSLALRGFQLLTLRVS